MRTKNISRYMASSESVKTFPPPPPLRIVDTRAPLRRRRRSPPPAPPSPSTSSETESLNEPESEPESEPISESPDADGYLRLKGNPGPWILNNPPDSHLLVKHLELDFSGVEDEDIEHEIDDSIDKLTLLTHLTICHANNSLACLPYSIANLHNVQHLKFDGCTFEEFPANMSLLKMNLTHFTLLGCDNIKSLPEIVFTLSNLTSLHLEDCNSLSKLTPNLGLLRETITHFTLSKCYLESLPKNFDMLSNLTCLHLHNCYETEFPTCLGKLGRLTELSLQGWEFEVLPDCITSLSNLTSLNLEDCNSLEELPPKLDQLGNLNDFSIKNCNTLQSLPDTMANLLNLESLSIEGCSSLTQLPDNLKVTSLNLSTSSIEFIPSGLINLQSLFLSLSKSESFVTFPYKLEGLDELILLDIEDTAVKYLPWSIMKLPKLRFLLLPWEFRMETLPYNLNDSVTISTFGRYIRKTWKQLKQERGVSDFLVAQVMELGGHHSIITPPGYLSLNSGLRQWINGNNNSVLQVKMLELELTKNVDIEGTKNSIGKLPNLTHLFVTYRNGVKKDCFPHTMGLKHLCLQHKDLGALTLTSRKLSNLHSLDLIVTTFPKDLILPITLRRLSLQSPCSFSFPSSVSMVKLSNLRTLELRGCYNLASLPPLKIVTLKIDRFIKSLPIGLRHLEILHAKSDCFDKDSGRNCSNSMLQHCLKPLVDLDTLSLTCYHIKSLPSMVRQRYLRVLLLKDCFALKELLPDVEQLVELHTLDISGTRIKSFPECITKLSKLQQLILPKCFTQKLPRKLEEVSIIDDTDKIYYKHKSYYDSVFGTNSDSSNESNDDKEIGSTEGVDEAITEDLVQGIMDEHVSEQNDVSAQVSRVSSSTMKRGMNEHGIICPSSKKLKQCHDAKEEGEPNTDSTCLENPSEQVDVVLQKVSKGAAATMATVEKPPLKYVKESNMEVPQHVEMHLDGLNQSNIAQPNGRSSSFDFVKACYEGATVWFDFSLTSSFDQLNESICKKFRLQLNKFKIQYLDEDKEWLLMTCVSDLTHALLHTSSSGRKFLRLSITDIQVVDTELHSDNANQSNTAQPNGSSSAFNFVKVCYEGVPVWIEFSLASSFDQLKESVSKKFRLEFNKFKLKYLDEDEEWLLMTRVSDLTHARLHTGSFGRKFIKLSITDKGV